MDFKAIKLIVLAATVVSVSSCLSSVPLKSSLLHEVGAFNVQILFFVDAHMFEEVSDLTFNGINSGADLVKSFFICCSVDLMLRG